MDSDVLVYGPIIGVHNVDDAIISHLQKWIQSYLNEVARQNGEPMDRLVKPRNYRASQEVEFMPEDQRPCCVVACQNIAEPPIRRADPEAQGKRVEAQWLYEIGIQVVANGQKIRSMPRAHQLAMMYISAARVALEQQPADKLGFLVDWVGEEPGGVESDAERTTAVGIGRFSITVPTAHIVGRGPSEPEADPPDTSPVYPLVDPEKVSINITKVP